MKKNKLLKLFLTFICIVAIAVVSDNVYGYQLKYKAYKDNNSEGALVRSYGQTSKKSKEEDEKKVWIGVGIKDSIYYTSANYATYKIVFHKDKASIYSEDNGHFYVGYDYEKNDNIFYIPQESVDDTFLNKLIVKRSICKRK